VFFAAQTSNAFRAKHVRLLANVRNDDLVTKKEITLS